MMSKKRTPTFENKDTKRKNLKQLERYNKGSYGRPEEESTNSKGDDKSFHDDLKKENLDKEYIDNI
jgi:hypothetical protein